MAVANNAERLCAVTLGHVLGNTGEGMKRCGGPCAALHGRRVQLEDGTAIAHGTPLTRCSQQGAPCGAESDTVGEGTVSATAESVERLLGPGLAGGARWMQGEDTAAAMRSLAAGIAGARDGADQGAVGGADQATEGERAIGTAGKLIQRGAQIGRARRLGRREFHNDAATDVVRPATGARRVGDSAVEIARRVGRNGEIGRDHFCAGVKPVEDPVARRTRQRSG